MSKEREAFENHLKKMGKTDNETFSKDEDGSYLMDIIHFGWKLWQAAKAQAVPEVAQRLGGYYIRDLRSQPGNCMKFWYQAGYGTKHKNFFLVCDARRSKRIQRWL